MAIVKPYIVNIARDFWSKVPDKPTLPYDIFGAVSLTMPLDIISLSGLTVVKIQKWLLERNVELEIGIPDRSLHGLILTLQNTGFIFIDGTDSPPERRYTVAHEASHFILDYTIPREKAVARLGTGILEVLDGHREATTAERIEGVLSSLSIQPFTHLLEKSGDGSFFSEATFNAENDADSLALELLAPVANIVRQVKSKAAKPKFQDFKTECCQLLCDVYGLPVSVSDDYATRLAYAITGGPSLLTKLGF